MRPTYHDQGAVKESVVAPQCVHEFPVATPSKRRVWVSQAGLWDGLGDNVAGPPWQTPPDCSLALLDKLLCRARKPLYRQEAKAAREVLAI